MANGIYYLPLEKVSQTFFGEIGIIFGFYNKNAGKRGGAMRFLKLTGTKAICFLILTIILSAGLLLMSCPENVNGEIEPSSNKPVITITTQPVDTSVTYGSISGNLSVAAVVSPAATLTYQWYSNSINSNSGGSAIGGQTGSSFMIPTTLAVNTYCYYVVVSSAGADSVTSRVAKVTVNSSLQQYTITLNLNGGTGTTPADLKVNVGNSVILPDNSSFSRTESTFAGWCISPLGEGNTYQASSSLIPTKDMILYARWVSVPLNITVTSAGGFPRISWTMVPNTSVTGYILYRNGNPLATVTSPYTDIEQPLSSSYQVQAFAYFTYANTGNLVTIYSPLSSPVKY